MHCSYHKECYYLQFDSKAAPKSSHKTWRNLMIIQCKHLKVTVSRVGTAGV